MGSSLRKKIALLLVFAALLKHATAQVSLPYSETFENAPTVMWTHYLEFWSDPWDLGSPSKTIFTQAIEGDSSWVTGLNGDTVNCSAYLQTPSFDLSDLSKKYVISFYNKRSFISSTRGSIEYSIDGGTNWTYLFNGGSSKINWQPTFGGYSTSKLTSEKAAHSLDFLQGNTDVRFRFKYKTPQKCEGWMIDLFSIDEEKYDIVPFKGDTIKNVVKSQPTIRVQYELGFDTELGRAINGIDVEYYFSKDPLLDGSDVLVDTRSNNLEMTQMFAQEIPTPVGLTVDTFYIIYKWDINNELNETNELNNINYLAFIVDTLYDGNSYKENFERGVSEWKESGSNSGGILPYDYWQLGLNHFHRIDSTHSGKYSYFINHDPVSSIQTYHDLSLSYIDFTTATNNVMCFWYKTFTSDQFPLGNFSITLYKNNALSDQTTFNVQNTRSGDWDCYCKSLSYLNGIAKASMRIRMTSYLHSTGYAYKINLDDIYIGTPKPDLSIEHKQYQFLKTNDTEDTLYYTIFNSGLTNSNATQAEFYWSVDSIFDGSDVLIKTTNEAALTDTTFRKSYFTFSKPVNTEGEYYILYKLDVSNANDEMWEENNYGFIRVKIEGTRITVPYYNDFENNVDGWYHEASLGTDTWNHGAATGLLLNKTFSGTKAFITNAQPELPDTSRMHLYTPIFDFTNITNPVLEFDMRYYYAIDPNDETVKIPAMNISYSTDWGHTWQVLDTTSMSFKNWFYFYSNETYFALTSPYMFNYSEKCLVPTTQYQEKNTWDVFHHVLDIAELAGLKNVRFRFNFSTLTNHLSEGALIDNFSIDEKDVDLTVTYEKSIMQSSLEPKINFHAQISNNGNYISGNTSVKYYLSINKTLDGADYYLGSEALPKIQPLRNHYVLNALATPAGFADYKYLVFSIDPDNLVTESDENNNTVFWPLALDSIDSYPYVQNFNDTIVDGWTQYDHDPVGNLMKGYRVRNILFPNETALGGRRNGWMFTDHQPSFNDNLYRLYLESPSFDFTNMTTIYLSFDMLCIGAFQGSFTSGGNMEYSLNGGVSWTVLTPAIPSGASNWYNIPQLFYTNNEPGWADDGMFGYDAVMPARNIDISFLHGNPNVVFRFKYQSSYDRYADGRTGLRVDNFRISNNNIAPVTTMQHDHSFFYMSSDGNELIFKNTECNGRSSVRIYNLLGVTVAQYAISNASEAHISIDKIPSGVYQIQFQSDECEQTFKFIKY